MKMYLIGLVLVTVATVQARTLHNPILSDRQYTYPAAIEHNGTYYVAANTDDITKGTFLIHSSKDLTTWKEEGYVLDASDIPKDSLMYYPKIHKIGSTFIVYYSVYNESSLYYDISAATASHPLGPYTPIDRPFLLSATRNSWTPTIINDEDKLYLLWNGATNFIYARQLNSNGLSLATDEVTTLIKPSLIWEDGVTWSPWYIRRGSYHYLVYNGRGGCDAGVARSSNALGPYEKLPNPIKPQSGEYGCTAFPTVVKDLDGKGDLIFFNADSKDQKYTVVVASVGWAADDWPYIE